MKRIYTLDDGQSAVGRLVVNLDKDLGDIGFTSALLEARGVIFRHTPSTYNYDSHNAPREQIIVNLDAAVDVTTHRDGTVRIPAGCVSSL